MERERRFRVGAAMNVEREKLQSGVFFKRKKNREGFLFEVFVFGKGDSVSVLTVSEDRIQVLCFRCDYDFPH